MAKITSLTDYRLLGKSGLRVSPLCLGTMTFGTEWGWGTELRDCRDILDRYLDQGGNFIDTANYYTNGTSERILGELLTKRRERVVIGTKYTLNMHRGDPNSGGNQRKNLVQSLEASLRRLKTEYIDLYWVHIWDQFTPIEEVMRALDDLVTAGKVLYVGISDMPAWKIAQANTIANYRGWTPFIAMQMEYSLVERCSERELIPMADEFGLGFMPWSPLGGSILSGKYDRKDLNVVENEGRTDVNREGARPIHKRLNDRNIRIVEEVERIADEQNAKVAQVALRWLLDKEYVTSLIIGARTPVQFEENLECFNVDLSDEQTKRLDEISGIDLGFPIEFINRDSIIELITGGTRIWEN